MLKLALLVTETVAVMEVVAVTVLELLGVTLVLGV